MAECTSAINLLSLDFDEFSNDSALLFSEVAKALSLKSFVLILIFMYAPSIAQIVHRAPTPVSVIDAALPFFNISSNNSQFLFAISIT